MCYEICSVFTKCFYLDMFNYYKVIVNDCCLTRIDSLYRHCYLVGFTNVLFEDDFITVDFIVRNGASRCIFHSFVLNSEDFKFVEI